MATTIRPPKRRRKETDPETQLVPRFRFGNEKLPPNGSINPSPRRGVRPSLATGNPQLPDLSDVEEATIYSKLNLQKPHSKMRRQLLFN